MLARQSTGAPYRCVWLVSRSQSGGIKALVLENLRQRQRKALGTWHLAVGSYPMLGLKAPRKARDAAKLQKSEGADPVKLRKLKNLKATRPDDYTFKAVALEWYGKQSPQWGDSHAERSLRQLERDLFPWIGNRPMTEIHAMALLVALQKVEEPGAIETAGRVLMLARQVWDYWLPTVHVQQGNITEGSKSRLTPCRGKNFAAILDPVRIDGSMRAIKG